MKYLPLLCVLLLLTSCGLADMLTQGAERLGDPEVVKQAEAIADDAIGGNYIGALYGIGAMLGLWGATSSAKAVGKKLRESEPGKIL